MRHQTRATICHGLGYADPMTDVPWYAPGHRQLSASARTAERLWRARKDSRTLDARLLIDPLNDPPSAGAELQLFYNGELLYWQRWPSRELAVRDAEDKLKALQIAGWATHW